MQAGGAPHRLPGSWSEVGSSSSSSASGSNALSSAPLIQTTPTSGSSTAAGSKGSNAGAQAQFIKGSGPRSSFMYSTSSVTGLTKADTERITAAVRLRAASLPGNSIHALMTGNGSPYQNIQARIM